MISCDNELRVPETPVKKQRLEDMKSAETEGMTPEKYIEDLDAQFLFDNFEDIIKVSFDREHSAEEQEASPERVLEFSEMAFESPVKVRFLDFSKSSSKKVAKMEEVEMEKKTEIENVDIEDIKDANELQENFLRLEIADACLSPKSKYIEDN